MPPEYIRIKKAPQKCGALGVDKLVAQCDVACLGTLGALFNIELNLLAFLQVTISIALNCGEMDEDVLSTFTLDEAETLITIEPLDSTNNTLRHFASLGQI
jgi:hypothetical protein